MKLALIQMDIAWQNKDKNHQRALDFIKRASGHGCELIVFPEMFTTGFSMDISKIDDGSETDSLLSEAAKQYDLYIIAGLSVKEDKIARNIARVYNRTGKIIAQYTKIHPFSYLQEDRYFIAGSETVIFDIKEIPSTVFICYDLRFPEIFRKVAKDVHLIFVIANWPSSRIEHWKTLLRARAIENQCFVIGVNRTGKDGNGISYPGYSCIYDPSGEMLLAGDERKEFLVAEIEPSEVLRIRTEFPFLKDMRLMP
ncbi:MAG: carbon-nitrogen family hydrolase [Thermodesulfovibrionales bacterium]